MIRFKLALLLSALCVAALLLPVSAQAMSRSSAIKLAKKLSPVTNPTLYYVSPSSERKKGNHHIWVYYVPAGGEPAAFTNPAPPTAMAGPELPVLGFGLAVNAQDQVIVNYYSDRQLRWTTGGASSSRASWIATRDGQPLDYISDAGIAAYEDAIRRLGDTTQRLLDSAIAGSPLRTIFDAADGLFLFYGNKMVRARFFAYTANATQVAMEIRSPAGNPPVNMRSFKGEGTTKVDWRNPGVRQWMASVPTGPGKLFAKPVVFSYKACNALGCWTSPTQWRWNPSSRSLTDITVR